MGTITTFDLDRFTRAAEERDAATQFSMYGPDAVVTITNKVSQPGEPRVLRTREEIKGWLEDMYSRDMTHKVQHRVHDDSGAAYTQACRYREIQGELFVGLAHLGRADLVTIRAEAQCDGTRGQQ